MAVTLATRSRNRSTTPSPSRPGSLKLLLPVVIVQLVVLVVGALAFALATFSTTNTTTSTLNIWQAVEVLLCNATLQILSESQAATLGRLGDSLPPFLRVAEASESIESQATDYSSQ